MLIGPILRLLITILDSAIVRSQRHSIVFPASLISTKLAASWEQRSSYGNCANIFWHIYAVLFVLREPVSCSIMQLSNALFQLLLWEKDCPLQSWLRL